MFSSLIEWCRFPIKVQTRTGNTAGGDPKYAEPVERKAYIVEEIEAIIDKHGKESISTCKLYLPPDVEITVMDRVIIGTSTAREIHRITNYFDGATGKASIQVVYL